MGLGGQGHKDPELGRNRREELGRGREMGMGGRGRHRTRRPWSPVSHQPDQTDGSR